MVRVRLEHPLPRHRTALPGPSAMPSLSKLVFLPVALTVAACLAWRLGWGRRAKSQRIRLALLDQSLATGNTFDKRRAEYLLGKPESINNWYRVPSWLAGSWRSEQVTTTYKRDERTGSEDRLDHLENRRHSGIKGTFSDNTGQVWEFDRQGYWDNSVDDNYKTYCWVTLRTEKVATDSEYSFHTDAIDFVTTKNDNIIRECNRTSIE